MSEFTVDAGALSAALKLVLSTAERKTTIPILACVLFEVGDEVKITGTDIDTFMSLNLSASKPSPGSFCVPAKHLFDLVSLMSGEVNFSVKEHVTVQSGRSSYKLLAHNKDAFPVIESAVESQGTISGRLLSEMMDAASIAASANPNDTEVSKSILLSAKDGKLRVVGCDQKRLALAQTPFKSEFTAAVSLRAAQMLSAFASKNETVEIFCDSNLFRLKAETGEAGSRLLSCQWPQWEMILPKTATHSIELDPSVLIPAIRRATLTTEPELRGLKFTLSKSEAVITSQTPEKGTGQEAFPINCESLNGDDFAIGLPGRQLLDLFKVSEGIAVWDITTPLAQVRFTPKEPLAFEFQYIVMPIRVECL